MMEFYRDGRFSQHAAAEEIAMEVGDHRAYVADAHCLALAIESAIASHERTHGLGPVLLVRAVHREVAPVLGNPNLRMRKEELADRRIEREAVRAMARRVDEHRARTIDHVSGRDLAVPRLQHVLQGAV